MDILPAIDLIGGKCVRLVQGQYDKQITYKDDPIAQAREFADAGSTWLHIVDLDGAKAGRPVNTESIKAIIDAGVPLKIEVGGGIRDEAAITELLYIGVERVIIGTRAINDFPWCSQMAEKYPNRLVLGLDARGSKLAVEGWLTDGELNIVDFAKNADNLPMAAIIYTDISKDGMLAGPNLERTAQLVAAVNTPIVAAGGVTSIDDVKNLIETRVAGAVIGRTLYEGNLDLKDAIEAAR